MNKKKVLIIEIAIFIVILIGITYIYNYLISKNNENYIKEDSNIIKEENKVEIIKIENAEQFQQEVISNEGTVFIDFYAEWCMPCKMMSPVIEELAKENSDVKFVKIDVDENEDLAMEYNVISIPTMIVMKNGEVTKTFVGVTSKNDIVKEF